MKTKISIPGFGLSLSPNAKYNFRIDFMGAVLFSLFNVVFNQFYVPIAIQQGASNVQVGLLTAAPAIGLLFSPFWAGLIEKTSPKPFVIYPNIVGRLLILVPAFFGSSWVFVATMLVFQFLMGMQAPAYASLITRIYPADARGRLMGYVRVAMGVITIPLAFLVGIWIDRSGPSVPLAAAAITGVISLLVFSRVREENIPAKDASYRRPSLKEQWKLASGHKVLLIFFAATTFAGFGNILASPIYQLIQVHKLGLSNEQIGYARMSYFTFLLITYFIAGWALDRFSPRKIILIGIAAYATIPLLYGFFGNYPSVLAGSGIQGIGDAIWDIGILSFVFRVVPGREAVVFGLHLMLFGIRGSIAPILSTTLSESLPYYVLLFSAAAFGWIGTLIFAFGAKVKEEAAVSVTGGSSDSSTLSQ